MDTSGDQPRRHRVGFAALLIPDSGINWLRFSSSEDLLDEGARFVDETGRTSIGGTKLLLAVQATRATHSFKSIIQLCRIGRGVQAAMINRSLLEDALDVHWVAANPDEAPALADQHERLITLGERAMFERFGRPDVEPLAASERAELTRLSGIYDSFRLSWTLATDTARVALIKERWNDPAADRFIDQTYQLIQRQNNVLLHTSPTALGIAMSPGRRGPNRVGPDLWWPQALAHGVLAYYFICRVIADEFDLPKHDAADAYFRASCFTRRLTKRRRYAEAARERRLSVRQRSLVRRLSRVVARDRLAVRGAYAASGEDLRELEGHVLQHAQQMCLLAVHLEEPFRRPRSRG